MTYKKRPQYLLDLLTCIDKVRFRVHFLPTQTLDESRFYDCNRGSLTTTYYIGTTKIATIFKNHNESTVVLVLNSAVQKVS